MALGSVASGERTDMKKPKAIRTAAIGRRLSPPTRRQVLQTPQGHHADPHGGRAGSKEPLFHPQVRAVKSRSSAR
jgi:hypothetical protein